MVGAIVYGWGETNLSWLSRRRRDGAKDAKFRNDEATELRIRADKKNAWRRGGLLTLEKVLTFIRGTMEKYPKTVERWWSLYRRADKKANRKKKNPVVEDIPDFLPKLARKCCKRVERSPLEDEEKRKKISRESSAADDFLSADKNRKTQRAGPSTNRTIMHRDRTTARPRILR